MSEKREISLKVEGINIAGELYIPSEVYRESFPALCICHGIPAVPSNPSDNGYPLLAERFCAAGFVTVIFNFRGTGVSGGNLDLLGWAKDLEAVISHLCTCQEADQSRLFLMGFSGGAAVSAYVAAHNPKVGSVVLCACPSQLDFLANKENSEPILGHFRHIGLIRDEDFPPSIDRWLEGFRTVSPIQWISKISPRPLLIVHGEDDEVVGVSHAWSLYKKAKEPKEIAIIEGGGHRLRLSERAMDTVVEWLKRETTQ